MDGPYAIYLLFRKLTDHLLGESRPNFRRLFLSTCKGLRCPELDRLGVKAAPCHNEIGDEEKGYWLPMWTWPLVQILFTASHRKDVAAGRSRPIASHLRPADGDASMRAVAALLSSILSDPKKEAAPAAPEEEKAKVQ